MALTVSSIQSDVSIDVRQVLAPTDSKLIGWIDRIHKDCLHSSIYRYLNLSNQAIDTVIGLNVYPIPIGALPVRRIVSVSDQTRNRILFPIERATSPVSQLEQQEPNPGQQSSAPGQFTAPLVSPISLQAGQPAYYRHSGPNLYLIPIPMSVLHIGIVYEQQVVTLVNPSDQLIVPEDGRDIVVAGVNYLANAFLKRSEEAQMWAQVYSALKKGESLV